MVRAEQVWKSFGRLDVLKGIDFVVQPQQTVVLLGPSGGGKSTILRCINHLEKIDAGRLWVDGELMGYRQRGDVLHEMKTKDVARQRSKIGMVFQRFNLFPHRTALENVMEAPAYVKHVPRAEAERDAVALLGQVGLGEKLDSYPAQLSGGQQQRVAIARALALRPKGPGVVAIALPRRSPNSPASSPGSSVPIRASLMITCLGDALFPGVA